MELLSEDHTELPADAIARASDVQLVVLDFVPDEDWEVQALFHACKGGELHEVEKLLRKPLHPDMKTQYSRTALQLAAEAGHMGIVRLLLKAGADADVADNSWSTTALHLAAENGHLDVVRRLVGAGVNKDAANYAGSTALHLAVENVELVRLLLLNRCSGFRWRYGFAPCS